MFEVSETEPVLADWEVRWQRRSDRLNTESKWPANVPAEVAEKGDEIDRLYDAHNFNPITHNFSPRDWETAAQAAAKLKVVALRPDQAELKDKFERIILAFDPETGTFPPNFDPKTGLYRE